jgi:hypothetical protein
MQYKYQFDSSSRKFICPDCKKKRFVKYVDANGNYLDSKYGKCDRPKCGYFQKPEKDSLKHLDTNKSNYRPLKPKPISYIETSLKDKTLKHYSRNDLFNFLLRKYDKEQLLKVFRKYNVGTSNKWEGSTIFWQVDYYGKVRSGKIMKYNKETGKRVKGEKPLITWVHSHLKLRDFNLTQVCFGEHLLSQCKKEDVICIVESEKTAIICAIEYSQFIWLATGSLYQFKTEMLMHLKDRKVIAFPDTDFFSIWQQKAKVISKNLNTKIHVSNYMMDRTIGLDQSKGFDLADDL